MEIDWKIRKNRYGVFLNIPDEYLDEELFASPAITIAKEYAIVEFLNFWMPHLCQCPFNRIEIFNQDKRILEAISTNNKSNIKKLIYVKHVRFVNTALQELKDDISWLVPYKKYFSVLSERFSGWEVINKEQLNAEFDKIIYGAINKLDVFVNAENVQKSVEMFARNSKKIIYEHIKQYFCKVQQTHFGQDTGIQPSLLDFPSRLIFKRLYDNEIFGGDLQQLPRFIDQHHQYFIDDRLVRVVSPDYAFSLEGQNYFYPNRYIPDMLLEYDKLFTALDQHIDEFPEGGNLQTAFNYFTKLNEYLEIHYENLVLPKALKNAHGKWIVHVRNIIDNKRNQILVALSQCYYFFKKDAKITPTAKLELLYAIGKYFTEKVKILFGENIPADISNICEDINQDLESFAKKNKLPNIAKFRLCNELKYICDRDKFNREQEKLKLQKKEAETQKETQKRLFSQLNHSIKNLVGSVSKTLSWTKNEYELSTPVRRLINRASQGANLISAIANAISLSYREDGDFWKKDLNAANDAESMNKIILTALFQAVPNILSGDNITQYRHEYELYFPTEEKQKFAETSWYQASSAELKQKWINENLFSLNLNIDESVKNLQIGDEHAALTHFFIFFSEIFLNTTKAVAYVERKFRKCDVEVTISNGFLIFDLRNSSCSDRTNKKDGFGHIVIENYCKKFEIIDFKEIYDMEEKMYKLHFKLPIIPMEE